MFRILPLFLLVLISFIFSSDRRISNNPIIFYSKNVSNVYGKIKFVQYNEDYKVRIVDNKEDLSVKLIQNVFYDSRQKKTGISDYNKGQLNIQWKIVNYFEDYRIKIVDKGEDFSIKYY